MKRFVIAAALAAVLQGCLSEPPKASEDPIDPTRREPATGAPAAPPLGSPAPKIAPNRVLDEDEER